MTAPDSPLQLPSGAPVKPQGDPVSGERRVIAANALAGYAGAVGVTALRLATKLVLIRSLDPADFGRVVTTQNLQALVVSLAGLGLGDAVVRFVGLHARDGTGRATGVVQRAGGLTLLLGTLTTVLLLAVATPVASRLGLGQDGAWGVSLAAFAIVPILLGDVLGMGFLGLNRTWVKVLAVDLARGAVTLGGYILLASIGWATFTGSLSVQLIAALVSAVCMMMAFRYTRAFTVPDQQVPMRALLAYSLPLFVSAIIGGTLVSSGVPLALAAQHPPEMVALYAVALTVAPLLQLPAIALENAALPVWAGAAGTTGIQMKGTQVTGPLARSFADVTRWGLILALLVFVPLVTAPRECLALLFGSQYAGPTAVVEVALVAALFAVAVGPTEGLLQAFGVTRAIVVARLVSGTMALAAAWPLVRAWGVMGAIIAWGGSAVISNTVSACYLYFAYGIQPFDSRYGRVLIAGVIGGVACAAIAATGVQGVAKLGLIIAANTSIIGLVGLLIGAWHPAELTTLVRRSSQVGT